MRKHICKTEIGRALLTFNVVHYAKAARRWGERGAGVVREGRRSRRRLEACIQSQVC